MFRGAKPVNVYKWITTINSHLDLPLVRVLCIDPDKAAGS